MPKKFTGENSKATAAKERKAAAKARKEIEEKQHLDNACWIDNDKQIKKKLDRKEKKEQKKKEIAERKNYKKVLLDEEMKALNSFKNVTSNNKKITRAEIEKTVALNVGANSQSKKQENSVQKLEENLNRLQLDGEVARTVEEAIAVLAGENKHVDKHPEKRKRASYLQFESKRLPELREENPHMRLSQIKQILFKEWEKSPENPLNGL